MSEQEFDRYLAVLGGMLRLSRKQRESISGELRDHLEQRLDELLAEGMSHDEAVCAALEEFGDASALAERFALVTREQKRRWVMRFVASGVAASILLAMGALMIWPGDQSPSAARALAQAPGRQPAASSIQANNSATEAKLAERIDASFAEIPIWDVIEYVAMTAEVQVYVNRKKIEDEQIEKADQNVTLELASVRGDMLLELALAQVGDLAYVIRDGIVIVSTAADLENATEVRVYNCIDLLSLSGSPARRGVPKSAGMQGGDPYGQTGPGALAPPPNRRVPPPRTGGGPYPGGESFDPYRNPGAPGNTTPKKRRGLPGGDPFGGGTSSGADPFSDPAAPANQRPTLKRPRPRNSDDPFGGGTSSGADPFSDPAAPANKRPTLKRRKAASGDPFGGSTSGADPFAGDSSDPGNAKHRRSAASQTAGIPLVVRRPAPIRSQATRVIRATRNLRRSAASQPAMIRLAVRRPAPIRSGATRVIRATQNLRQSAASQTAGIPLGGEPTALQSRAPEPWILGQRRQVPGQAAPGAGAMSMEEFGGAGGLGGIGGMINNAASRPATPAEH